MCKKFTKGLISVPSSIIYTLWQKFYTSLSKQHLSNKTLNPPDIYKNIVNQDQYRLQEELELSAQEKAEPTHSVS